MRSLNRAVFAWVDPIFILVRDEKVNVAVCVVTAGDPFIYIIVSPDL